MTVATELSFKTKNQSETSLSMPLKKTNKKRPIGLYCTLAGKTNNK
jgi:hypothetical protein